MIELLIFAYSGGSGNEVIILLVFPLTYSYLNVLGNSYPGTMEPGMTFTIEPVLSLGSSGYIEILDDGWTAITEDNSRTAQEEHTILITDKGCEILTL